MLWDSSFKPALQPGHRQGHREDNHHGYEAYNPKVDEIIAMFPEQGNANHQSAGDIR